MENFTVKMGEGVIFVTDDRCVREIHDKGIPDVVDVAEIAKAALMAPGAKIQFMTPVQLLELIQKEYTEEFKQWQVRVDKGRVMAFQELARSADDIKRHLDARIGLRLTQEQAEQIRKWRVEERNSWRLIARSAWPWFMCWTPESNQLAGMSLCEFAARKFKENYREEPWN